MLTSDFDYHLPPELIAQTPAEPRDSSRLLVMDRQTGALQHKRFFDLGEFLNAGDLLVLNETKVYKARLITADGIEIFLLRPEGDHWLVIAKPGRKLKPGTMLRFEDGQTAMVKIKHDDGTIIVDFKKSTYEIFAWTDRIGKVPIPPYIDSGRRTQDVGRLATDYQTVYAKHSGSVAAPTAGFHFTTELIEKLKKQGVNFAAVTLHVGLGTFRPIKSDKIEDHIMHEEWIDVPETTRSAIHDTRAHGGRVIAVGTTTVRALESEINRGFTNIFIKPGYQFKSIDGLITNFHLPKSTLLILVSAFAGRDLILKAYAEAIEKNYRFYSFGNAMLII
ncbi:tRNA preQ1(34) S-adenosylmethionine ribosyltransferase-isomerase QueA [Patescibacteria group bacterium]|nr:tRNA preQ1(34) S-adenosylmethionine ribosyltransferase-isomerase QueA [Patescibacteria group bacterium]MBU1034319.1 tRNA preQ1(34) S-adenosylmethionine ribosyltransferase-isomerase QueA [Patescibacteria group bacterium]MBU1629800.1 tRNA preQ1(34) S-adenosylmethionine ribosyltransferase-isomerase QueA [Patescibacteria group bacterium]MBU1907773.1 tRNA preQ1(34) S-adenosylmethionine ribosyltransferase-isomerase QueA [Patescibacteria group bacterium]